jgi:hypothetical protein
MTKFKVGDTATFHYRNVKWKYGDPIFVKHHGQTVSIIDIAQTGLYVVRAADGWTCYAHPSELS